MLLSLKFHSIFSRIYWCKLLMSAAHKILCLAKTRGAFKVTPKLFPKAKHGV